MKKLVRLSSALALAIATLVSPLQAADTGKPTTGLQLYSLRSQAQIRGIPWVLDQVMRIMLHGRMAYGLERYRREHPDVDILLIQPTRDDMRMFGYNIMRTSARRVVAEHGYRSTLAVFRRSAARHRRLFAKHGVTLADPRRLPGLPRERPPRAGVARALEGALDRLESKLGG